MQKTIIIENIEAGLVYALEKAQFEYEMRQQIVNQLLKNDTINISTERFQIYLKELDEKGLFYTLLKNKFEQEIVSKYLPDDYDNKKYSWNLLYMTRELIIKYNSKDTKNEN